MPSVFSHFLILENLYNNFAISNDAKKCIQRYPEYAYWGSIGPDYLFFYPPDWETAHIKDLFEYFYKFEIYTQEISEILEKANGIYTAAPQAVIDNVTGGVYDEMKDTLSSVATLLAEELMKIVTSRVDLFDFVKPPMYSDYLQDDRSKKWWWMDIGHHVRTLDFARKLWTNAQGNEKHLAYTYGYLSHIGSDVIGHAYVNGVVGGPYRNHWRRHVLVEKCIDSHLWLHVKGESLSNSNAFERIHFNYPGYDFPRLPEDFADYLSKTFNEIYSDLHIHSGVPKSEDIQFMYSYMYKYVKSASSRSLFTLPPPPDEFDWWDLPSEIQNRLNNILNPPPVSSPPLNDLTNFREWKRFLRGIFGFVNWAVGAIVNIAGIPTYAIARLGSTGIRYIIWLLQKLIFEVYNSIKLALVLGAYQHPEKNHLIDYFNNIINPPSWNIFEKYPFCRVFNSEQTYHLVHPFNMNGRSESTPTSAFFNSEGGIGSIEALLKPYLQGSMSDLDNSCPLALTNQLDILPNRNFISASDFSLSVFREFESRNGIHLPNWNLDSDRGFAWPEWVGNQNAPWTNYSQFNFLTCTP
ncbi:MAG: hypothetical protein KIT80_03260 [Chitinophagaceae bacterium]|nr:hypothetical protein [Chitinophagaceae bacterium]MCW5925904.1 hypothetical protein [Chitinophagaceae bacterium]